MIRLSGVLDSVPGGALSARAIMAALYEWQRKSELSADRAGLLATQDPAVAFRVHMKLACGSGDLSELDQTSFFAQGQEYLDSADLRDSVLKLLLIEEQSHPFAVVRAAELRRWVDSGEYTAILGGTTRAATRTPRRACRTRPSRPRTQLHARPSRPQDALGKLVHDVAASSAAPSSGSTSSCAATATEGGPGEPGSEPDDARRPSRSTGDAAGRGRRWRDGGGTVTALALRPGPETAGRDQSRAAIASWMASVRRADSTCRFSTIRPL